MCEELQYLTLTVTHGGGCLKRAKQHQNVLLRSVAHHLQNRKQLVDGFLDYGLPGLLGSDKLAAGLKFDKVLVDCHNKM